MTPETANLLDALEVLYEVTMALHWDVVRCGEELKVLFENHPKPTPEQREEGQFWLRSFTRTFFALVEGVSFTLRQLTLALHERGQLRLSVGEQALLSEKRYFWDKGKVGSADAFNKALDNLQIALTLFPRAFGVEFQLTTGDHRYGSFRQALRLRDAITHPKNGQDLQLSNESIKQLYEALAWFPAEVQRMQRLCYGTIDPNVWEEWKQLRDAKFGTDANSTRKSIVDHFEEGDRGDVSE